MAAPATYTPEQRAAIIAAIVDRGLSAVAACKLAAEGQLDGLAPFTMRPGSARGYAAKERRNRARARAETLGVVGAIGETADDLAATVGLMAHNVAHRAKQGKAQPGEIEAVAKAARTVLQLGAETRRLGYDAPEPEQTDTPEDNKPAGIVDQLAADVANGQLAARAQTEPRTDDNDHRPGPGVRGRESAGDVAS